MTAKFGNGRLLADRVVEVTGHDGKVEQLRARHVVLASGSEPTALKFLPFDGQQVIDSWGALELDCGPEAPVRHRRRRDRPRTRQRVAPARLRSHRARGTREPAARGRCTAGRGGAASTSRSWGSTSGLGPRSAEPRGQGRRERAVRRCEGRADPSLSDKIVVAVGRRPYTAGLLAEGTGVRARPARIHRCGRDCRTGVANVWAVGDAVRGPMLAHKGKEEGIMVADLIAGRYAHVNYSAWCRR